MIIGLLVNVALILGLQILFYSVFVRPRILTWGATDDEVSMPLIGDELAHFVSATRAISIHAPSADVWQWVIQLGADRGGFFSYELLERALGYEMRALPSVPEFSDMDVGRMIPASLDDSKSLIKYSFPVVAVDPGKAFVVGNWGAFVLKPINSTHTRLIVRTHGRESSGLLGKVDDFAGPAMHYIMERRMLMGLKNHAEGGGRLSATADNLWLLGMLLSATGIAVIVFAGAGVQSAVLSAIYGIAWLWTLLIIDPRPVFSWVLVLLIAATAIWLV